jgi:photosystem II stability/assembly factor-like uncharacterized protein
MSPFLRKIPVLLIAAISFCGFGRAQAQYFQHPAPVEIQRAPAWAQEMYKERPNLWEVDRLFAEWMKAGKFQKSYHTQYYKRWRREAVLCADDLGFVDLSRREEMDRKVQEKRAATAQKGMGVADWSLVGPLRVYNDAAAPKANQTNVYSLGRCLNDPNILYCGTETAIVFKSTDNGNSWVSVSHDMAIGAPGAIAVHPDNGDIAFFGAGNSLYRTTNGGSSWSVVFTTSGFNAHEIYINSDHPNIVMAAGGAGLFRSNDGGNSWSTLYTEECWDIKENAADPSKVYMLLHDPTDIRAEFYLSGDSGATFTPSLTGWYSSSDPARYDGGARLAVTAANPNRIYAYLIGESKSGDYGFIGLWRSDDGGATWTLPNAPVGGPYTSTHINTAIGYSTWLYHQGFYNCALMASHTNADSVLIGGLSLYCTTDAGASWASVSGYAGGPLGMHVDNQDFRAFEDGEYWISTDGGIYRSTNFFATPPQVRMNGIYGSDFWGFGQGWNQDVVTGGLYHNGNISHYQDYTDGEFLSLGGGEASTGYVNPGDSRLVFHSDVGGAYLPASIGAPIQWKAFGLAPNESYWAAESSELEWHPNCYNIGFLGRDHKLWKTVDGAATFTLVDSFGTDANSRLAAIEISRSNPNVMYVAQRPASGIYGSLHKTTDGGSTWTTLTLPGTSTNRNRILLALSPDDADKLWIAYPSGGNGTKVYQTTNGGSSWTNLTTSDLDGESVHSLVHVGGSLLDGLYAFTNNTVYYRNSMMATWTEWRSGLPLAFSTDIGRVFYRDGKIRSASYGKGIWEASLFEQPVRPIANASVDRFSTLCTSDTFFFEDYSMLNHAGAAWSWTFEDGVPATSSLRNPAVTFSTEGFHTVTLTVRDSSGASSSDTLEVEVTGFSAIGIAEDFETSFPPLQWENATTGPLSWQLESAVGGYGTSSRSAMANNYDIDATLTTADLRAPVDFTPILDATLTFDVAYTPWGSGTAYSDTLEVLVSTDCGLTFTSLYKKGGMDLSTTGSAFGSAAFVPTSGQWRTDTVDLSAYAGNPSVFVVFRNIGNWGQRMYLDNIELATILVGQHAPQQEMALALAPNPVVRGGSVSVLGSEHGPVNLRLTDAQGKLVLNTTVHAGDEVSLASLGLAAGVYPYLLESATALKTGKLVVLEGR